MGEVRVPRADPFRLERTRSQGRCNQDPACHRGTGVRGPAPTGARLARRDRRRSVRRANCRDPTWAELPMAHRPLWRPRPLRVAQPLLDLSASLDPNRPSTTLQAQPGPWVGPFHWENVRNASGDERARRLRVNEMLHSCPFPMTSKIDGSRSDVQRQLGNAVPVELGKAVVRASADESARILGAGTASLASWRMPDRHGRDRGQAVSLSTWSRQAGIL